MGKTKSQIEAWALDVIDRSRAGQRVEDDRVELKGEWVEPAKAARRIAALANAARTEPFLVLIGVEECVGPTVLPAEPEFGKWWSQVKTYFDHAAPRLEYDLIVEGVHVLYFEPDWPPYLVKRDPMEASGLWEVPWREGTHTRSARHGDLIRILVPRGRVPDFEVLKARASTGLSDKQVPSLSVEATLYIAPQSPERIVLPFHRTRMEVRWEGADEYVPLRGALYSMGERKSRTIHAGNDEVVVEGPGRLSFLGYCEMRPELVPVGKALEIRVQLDPLPESERLMVPFMISYSGGSSGRHFWGVDPPAPRPAMTRFRRRGAWMSRVLGDKPWSVRG